MENLLNIVLFLPLLSALLLCGNIIHVKFAKIYAIAVSIIELILALMIWYLFDTSNVENGFRFVNQVDIISSIGFSYFVGIDGISLFLVLLSVFMTLISIIYLNNVDKIKHFLVSLLILESVMIGVFIALDVMLFYIFWEFSLIPMLYIIGAWGGEKKLYAAIKFFLYTFSASLLMLFGILCCAYLHYSLTGKWSFSIIDWYRFLNIGLDKQQILFIAFFIGIAVKVPMFPFHTWLPYAHGQAPSVGSIILASILLKMGSYAFIRFSLPLFPDATISFILPIAILCVIMVIYTSMIAYVQNDMKQVIAYSSIAHMGVIVLGTFALNVEGISGSIFFMLSHGIISGALFLMVGILYDRTHTKLIKDYGGIASVMPRFTIIFVIALMGSVGLPLTMGFVGEFLSLLGFFNVNVIIALLAGSSIIVGAVYMLNLFRNVFLGNITNPKNKELQDINLREKIALIPLVCIIIWLGIYPKAVLDKIDVAANEVVALTYNRAILNESKDFILKVNRRD
ncbi:NADH-quinone oxidoreductase subunit M [Helicobacter sp. MIT 99-5507]|uniref:NADH-quinone oxidoreductase subunit M n=1 Tax=Helicobacter sp. MIT 99-5507 TaxID=152489 RepID=UPI000E1EA3E0|nr:NADH-quinone oxidoreductase subunit M [Helicobacter sp. MIT 99-5507]RDU57379.1 NADH-quinone oxidoreductase subunit M [Helicobacter sp. MIT 99-5507]